MWPVYVPEPEPAVLPKDEPSFVRHVGMSCGCLLLNCCHNEDQPPCGTWGMHMHSGNPATGYLYSWEPDDESWRDSTDIPGARITERSQKRPADGG